MPSGPFYDMPYASQRMPVMASRCVATSQPLAAQAGLSILQQGGNAIDAAIATASTLAVVEPTSNGLGGDCFALIWTDGQLHGLNALGRSAKRLDPAPYLDHDAIPLTGWDSVTVPGAVSGWAAAHARFGRLPFDRVLAPAIGYARRGYLVSPITAKAWARAAAAYDAQQFPAWHATFAPGGAAPRPGRRFACPEMAASLELIAQSHGEAFYRGALAQQIISAAEAGGSPLRLDDLAEHRPDWVQPLSMPFAQGTVHELPPSGQGIAALIALGILKRFDLRAMSPDDPRALHLQIEAMKLAFADAHTHVADPDHMRIDPATLLDEAYLDKQAARIDPERAQDFRHGPPRCGGTVLLTTADGEGRMVTWIQSNYMGFGSGVVVPGTGIALHNRGCGFSTEPGHPNQIAPGKRPYHTIIPGFVTRRDSAGPPQPLMAFGVMGGFMQPQGHTQVILRTLLHGQNPQAALDAPRWRVESGLTVAVEPGFGEPTMDALRACGHALTVSATMEGGFGRGQCIYRLEAGYLAASDPRADGAAVGD